MEGIGVVTRTGPGTRFRAGDNVLVSVPDIFRRYATIDPADGIVELLPEGAGTDFAGSFVPLFGAHYGLVHAARLGPGETVLVHGAAGGTGLAAVQVARQLGARVIGSAGTRGAARLRARGRCSPHRELAVGELRRRRHATHRRSRRRRHLHLAAR